MNWGGFFLLALGPILAIAVEALNPVSERMIRRSVEHDLRDYEETNHQPLIESATKLTLGAVEVTGLAPTIVAVATTGSAMLHEIANPYFPMLVYLAMFVLMVLGVIRLLGGLTFGQIEDSRPEYLLPFRRKVTLPWTPSWAISYIIYSANITLILVAFLTLYFAAPAKDAEKPKSTEVSKGFAIPGRAHRPS
jgi:hypothetical protein